MMFKICPKCKIEFIQNKQSPFVNLYSNKPFKCANCDSELIWENNIYYKLTKYGFFIMLLFVLSILIIGMQNKELVLFPLLASVVTVFIALIGMYKS